VTHAGGRNGAEPDRRAPTRAAAAWVVRPFLARQHRRPRLHPQYAGRRQPFGGQGDPPRAKLRGPNRVSQLFGIGDQLRGKPHRRLLGSLRPCPPTPAMSPFAHLISARRPGQPVLRSATAAGRCSGPGQYPDDEFRGPPAASRPRSTSGPINTAAGLAGALGDQVRPPPARPPPTRRRCKPRPPTPAVVRGSIWITELVKSDQPISRPTSLSAPGHRQPGHVHRAAQIGGSIDHGRNFQPPAAIRRHRQHDEAPQTQLNTDSDQLSKRRGVNRPARLPAPAETLTAMQTVQSQVRAISIKTMSWPTS